MTYLNLAPSRSSVPAALLVVLSLCAFGAQAAALPCADPAALQSLLDAQHGLARAVRESPNDAVRGMLADDAWVLEPKPLPARALRAAGVESLRPLAGSPQVAVVAASGDLGFTSGPFEDTRGTTTSFGHFLTVWHRGEDCRWRVVVAGGVTHAPPPAVPAPLSPPPVVPGAPHGPPADLAALFESVTAREGLSAALRTYARNDGFLLLVEGQPPLDLGQAEPQLRTRVLKQVWRESVRGVSADGTLSYVAGGLEPGAFTQIWQYDPRTANWGLRVLLLTAR